MSYPHLIMWGVVLVVGWSFHKGGNLTAGALVMAWLAGETVYLITGNPLPIAFYLYPDVFVLAVIFAKPEWCNLRPYRSAWHQLQCILLERSPADRVVMLVFPAMWLTYGLAIHPYYKWWALWTLAIVQFAAAGWESFAMYRRARAVSDTPGHTGAEFQFALVRRGYG